jgi:hypothetical protein
VGEIARPRSQLFGVRAELGRAWKSSSPTRVPDTLLNSKGYQQVAAGSPIISASSVIILVQDVARSTVGIRHLPGWVSGGRVLPKAQPVSAELGRTVADTADFASSSPPTSPFQSRCTTSRPTLIASEYRITCAGG